MRSLIYFPAKRSKMEDPLFSNSDLFATAGDSDDDDNFSRTSSPEMPRPSETGPIVRDTPPPSNEIKPKKRPKERNRMTKLDIKRLHSESQRLIRESTIKLPHYQPKLKTIDSFLSKINSTKVTLKKAMPKGISSQFTRKESPDPKSHDPRSHDSDVGKENISKEISMERDTIPFDVLSTESPMESLTESLNYPPTKSLSPPPTELNHLPTESHQTSLRSFFCTPPTTSEENQPHPLIQVPSIAPPPHPLLSSVDDWSEIDISVPKLTPVQELQKRFFKQIGQKPSKQLPSVDDKPGAARERLRTELQKQLASQKAEERKKVEEEFDQEEVEEELEEEEEEEAEFSSDEEANESDHEWARSSEEEVLIHQPDNDDETLFVPVRKSRHILIDDDNDDVPDDVPDDVIATPDDVMTTAPDDVITATPIMAYKEKSPLVEEEEEEEASMGPLVLNESIDSELFIERKGVDVSLGEKQGELEEVEREIQQDCTPEMDPVLEDNTQLTIDYLDTTNSTFLYPNHSLPPHQIPKLTRDSSTDNLTSDITRHNSTVSSMSDKDLFRNLDDGSVWERGRKLSVVDEDTQFLDAEGFLCFREQCSKVLPSFSAVSSAIGRVREELPSFSQVEALCSGPFQTLNKMRDNSQCTISDVIGFCSGAFPATAVPHTQVTTPISSESEEEEDAMPTLNRKTIHTKPQDKSERLQQFVESEAELSGTDMGSDEDEEEVGGDSFEEEEGAGSDVPLSETELWDQVTKVHLKQLADDDKANLRDMKERFLLEGDLYEDGLHLRNGFFRTRHFSRTGGSEASIDLFSSERDQELIAQQEEEEPVGSQVEAKKRRERLEKEEFIRKCQEKSNLLSCDEDSQSILRLIKETSNSSLLRTPDGPSITVEPLSSANIKRSRCGSFLKHNSSTLQRISSYTNSTPSLAGSGRGFVFKSGSAAVTPTSAHKSIVSSTSNAHPIKKLKLDSSISLPNTGSVFDQL